MSLLSWLRKDEAYWYETVDRLRSAPDPDLNAIGEQMDQCPNNPRHGGPGFFGKDRPKDRR